MINLPEKLKLLPVHFRQAREEIQTPEGYASGCCPIHQALRPYIPAGYVFDVEANTLYATNSDGDFVSFELSEEAIGFVRDWDDTVIPSGMPEEERVYGFYPEEEREIQLLSPPRHDFSWGAADDDFFSEDDLPE